MALDKSELPNGAAMNELLTVLSEECAEVIHVVCKAQRFGLSDVYPERGATNAELIADECGDVLAVIERVVEMPGSPITREAIEANSLVKHGRLDTWLRMSSSAEQSEDEAWPTDEMALKAASSFGYTEHAYDAFAHGAAWMRARCLPKQAFREPQGDYTTVKDEVYAMLPVASAKTIGDRLDLAESIVDLVKRRFGIA